MAEAGKRAISGYNQTAGISVPYVRLKSWPAPEGQVTGELQDAIWVASRG